MQQTEIYKFNLMESTDKFEPEPLKDNAEKMEAALAKQSNDIQSAAASSAKLSVGFYKGTGSYGSGNPNKLSFSFEPKVLMILMADGGLFSEYQTSMLLIRPSATGVTGSNSDSRVTVIWGENSVTWYSSAPGYQLNSSQTYYYFALG